MTRQVRTLPPEYFIERYEANPDPWSFSSSLYEHQKYASTLSALPLDIYENGLEVGCSIGVFTEMLASRCKQLLAVDAAEAALRQARKRCAPYANVKIENMFIPETWPIGSFDLIVFSEVLYYLDGDDLDRLIDRISDSVTSRAHLILIHWTGTTDYPMSGDEAASNFLRGTTAFTRLLLQKRTPQYRLDLLQMTV